MGIKQLVLDLKKSSSYHDWRSLHQNSFLSHLFTKIDQDLTKTGEWDIGYFCPDENKVTIFSKDETGNFFLKNTDDVFYFKTSQKFVHVDIKMERFIKLLSDVIQCLESEIPPLSNKKCNYCIFAEKYNNFD